MANTAAPATATAKGRGCSRTIAGTIHSPRRNRPGWRCSGGDPICPCLPAARRGPGGDQSVASPQVKATFWRSVILVSVAGFAAFWAWALFFASKEAVNKIDDRAWAGRAEHICAAARPTR